jgi:hypothetical protein
MQLRKIWIGYILFLLSMSIVIGQTTFQPKQVASEWKGIIYRNEISGRASIHTNGYSFAYNRGQIKTFYKTNYYHFELGFMSDAREQKQNRNIPRSFNKISQSFKFGKQNHLYLIRIGKGRKTLISDKVKQRGVALGYDYHVGPALAILRPYYLELEYKIERDDEIYYELRKEKYSKENADKFLDYNSVFGGASNGNGWRELSIVPGLQGKLGLTIAMGSTDATIRRVHIGMMGELFINKIPIMVETPAISNKPYFLNFYASVEFGKRTN